MKILLALIVLVSQATFASSETTLDLKKFQQESRSKILAEFGRGSIETRSEEILFQDGAGAMDLNPASDFAAVNYVAKLKSGILPKDFLISYRLSLAGGVTDFTLVKKDADTLIYYSGKSGVAVLRNRTTRDQVKTLIQKIQSIAHEAKVKHLEAVGALIFECSPKNVAAIMNELDRSPIIDSVEADGEAYPVPFQFESYKSLSLQVSKVETEDLRTLTKEMKKNGIKFVVPAIVPERLR